MKLLKRFKNIKVLLRQELKKFDFFFNISNELDKTHLLNLKRNKVLIIKNFMTKESCQKIIHDMDKILETGNTPVWKDEVGADTRIFGAEKISNEIEIFSKNSFINNLGNNYQKEKLDCFMIMANKLTHKLKNQGSGGGWHKDSFAKQFKAILYLNDVNHNNGPFQYIEDSDSFLFNLKLLFMFDWEKFNNRFSNTEIQAILDKTKKKVCEIKEKAGTLILVDTSIIHRGKPINSGARYALTNYMYPKRKFKIYDQKFQPRILSKKF